MSSQAIQKRCFQYFLAMQQTKKRLGERLIKNRKNWIPLAVFVLTTPLTGPRIAMAAPLSIDLNRALQIGWYSLRVQNPFGTNYTGLTTIKSYNPASKEFVFGNQQGQDVIIRSDDISFIYFRQLPDRSDVNVNAGDIRNIQITPYREFLYDVPPGQLNIQAGTLLLNTRWRMAEQKPFGVSTAISPSEGGTVEQIEIPRRIQLNYLGNHILVESELVNMVTRRVPEAGGGTIPRPLPTNFPIPAPQMQP